MSNNILFIFEGPKTEISITNNLIKFFVNENTVITCAYCTTIYKMYSDISADEYLDIFNLVKDIDANKDALKDYKRSDFAQIFMFFDYDGHATNASDKKLKDLLDFFNEETEKGKLYISYPMVEALKHIESYDTFKDLIVASQDFENYKKLVSNNCIETLKHFHLYDIDTWKLVIKSHLMKMNDIVNDINQFPISIIDQLTIFGKQIEKYISKDKTVSVLSAFPIFLHDYYGNEELRKRIE
jgi:hypothetical protein